MRRREAATAAPPWPAHLADFVPEAWPCRCGPGCDGGVDDHRADRWFRWVHARTDWLMAQGYNQQAAVDLAWDTDVRPDRE